MSSRVPVRFTIALIVAASALTACRGAGSSTPKDTPTPEVPGPEAVIGDWVRTNRNVDFVGLCQNSKPGIDVGKLCTNELGQRGTRRAYALGPTFSEATALVMVEQAQDGTWKVVHVHKSPAWQAPHIQA